jgi:hypothetical protein
MNKTIKMADDQPVVLRDRLEMVTEEQTVSPPLLPPTDQGKQANLVLLGVSLLQLPVWGEFVAKSRQTDKLTFCQGFPYRTGCFKKTTRRQLHRSCTGT